MAPTPRVTVLMTLYNKGPFVEEAIASVLAQTYGDFELLVVDDASTDGGLEKVKAIPDPRIRILETTVNGGRAAAANRGYEAALGEYIAPMDADDIMVPERLAKQVAFMDQRPEVAAVGAWARAFGVSDQLMHFPDGDAACRGRMLFGMPVLYGASMFRTGLLRTYEIRSPDHWRNPAEDRFFMVQLGRHGQYANLQEVLLHYRQGEQNQRHGRDRVQDMHQLYTALFQLFSIPASEREITLQTFLHDDLGGPPPNAAQVWALAGWLHRLRAMNRKQQVFPVAEFEAELERRWLGLFHRLAPQHAWAALLHMGLTGLGRERFGYWAKVTKDRWFGRGQ
jgi:glycosyltransferase involved in cell wall biosynthesis